MSAALPGLAGLEECDSLTVYNLVDNEIDSLSSACACCVDASSSVAYSSEFGQHISRKGCLDFNEICNAAHGLSLLLVAKKGDKEHACLFDAGPDPLTFEGNVRKLGVDLSAVEHIVLSHYHIDHSGGLRSAVPLIAKARKEANLPPPTVDLHPDYPDSRGMKTASGTVISLVPENPSFTEIESMGGVVLASKEPRAVCGRYIYISGDIRRETTYEVGLTGHMTKRKGEWIDDPEISDERYLAVNVRGCGLVVFSSCSHAGIVNVCKDVVSRAGIPLFGIMGGLHLAGGPDIEGRIQETVVDLVRLDPKVIFCGHCTGWKAKIALSQALRGRVQPASVGGKYTFVTQAQDSTDKINNKTAKDAEASLVTAFGDSVQK